MKKIQSGLQEVDRSKKGLTSIVNLDKLGDEFSNEILKKSFDRLIEKYKSNISYFNFRAKGNPKKVLSILSYNITSNEDKKELMQYVNDLIDNNIKTYRETHLNEFYINGTHSNIYRNFWWDIESDIVIWESKDGSFGKKLLDLIKHEYRLLNKEEVV